MLMNFRSTVLILRAFSDERSWFSVVCISTHAQRISARRSLLKAPFPANGTGFLHMNGRGVLLCVYQPTLNVFLPDGRY